MTLFSSLLAQAGQGTRIGGRITAIGGYSPEDVKGGSGTPIENITSFATNLFGFLTSIAGLMFLLFFVLGGLRWITAGGDQGNVEEAKKQMTNAAIGLVVVVAAYAIASIIGGVLGLDILNPSTVLEQITPDGSGSSNQSVPNSNPFAAPARNIMDMFN